MELEHAEHLITEERRVRDGEAHVYDQRSDRLGWELSLLDDRYEQLLALTPDSTVLDAGSGTGRHIPWLLERAARVVGVDHSPESLEQARKRLLAGTLDRVTLVEGDVRALPLDDASVDRILCSEVLSVLPADENRTRAVRELFRVLRPGGVAVISGYHWLGAATGWRRNGYFQSEYGRIPFHAFTFADLRRLLSRAGFEEIEVGGAVVFPSLAKRTKMSAETQLRLSSTVLRYAARWAVARGTRPVVPPSPS